MSTVLQAIGIVALVVFGAIVVTVVFGHWN
jgi:hypothetical protein